MTYEFDYKVLPSDMLVMTLKGMYSSLAGTANMVFTFSIMALSYRFWNDISIYLKLFLMLCIIFFPIIQPIIIYKRFERQLKSLPDNLKIAFDNKGFRINQDTSSTFTPWSSVNRISKSSRAIVIYTNNKGSYILTKRVVKDKYDEFYEYLKKQVK